MKLGPTPLPYRDGMPWDWGLLPGFDEGGWTLALPIILLEMECNAKSMHGTMVSMNRENNYLTGPSGIIRMPTGRADCAVVIVTYNSDSYID